MSKEQTSGDDRSTNIEKDVQGSIIITGDKNVFHFAGDQETADRSSTPSQPPEFPPAYREWLLRQCADIDLVGLRLKESRSIKLNHVYVPLTTPARGDHHQQPDARRLAQQLQRERKSELLLDALNDQSLYVSGPPGSGKSTFCRWVTWLACAGEIPEHPDEEKDDLREQFPESLRNRLPVLIRLRDFWSHLPQDAGQELSLAQFEKSLGRWLADKRPGDLTWDMVAPHVQQGSAMVIGRN